MRNGALFGGHNMTFPGLNSSLSDVSAIILIFLSPVFPDGKCERHHSGTVSILCGNLAIRKKNVSKSKGRNAAIRTK